MECPKKKGKKATLTVPCTIQVWHRDGVIDLGGMIQGKVYRNAELADTGGKYEQIVIVLDKKL